MSSDAERIEQLRREIRRHDRLYYVEAAPEISDRRYDALFDELKRLEAGRPELITPDSPTQRVGGRPVEGFARVRHDPPMLSIDNTYNLDELREFDARVAKALGGSAWRYLVEPKIDGVAAALRYEDGLLRQAATRGDGRTGDDITVNARTIKSIPLRLTGQGGKGGEIPRLVEVRGEIYWPREAFNAYNAKRADEGLETFANPRNGAAGTLKQLDPKVVAERSLAFIAHGFGAVEPTPAENASDLMEMLKRWGVPASAHTRMCDSVGAVCEFIEQWAERRYGLPYETDGAVVKVDSLAQRRTLGETSRYPRWCIAYKYAAERAETVLRDVSMQVGRLGTITPVAHFDPVRLAGTTVSNASLHNFDNIAHLRRRNIDVRIHDAIVVEKAGEIIPQVVDVILNKRPKDAREIRPPKICPECGGKLKWDSPDPDKKAFRCVNPNCELRYERRQLINIPEKCRTRPSKKNPLGRGCDHPVEEIDYLVELRCVNPECPAQLKESLNFYVGRNQMNIEDMGPKVIEQLVNKGLVKHFADIYKLTLEDITSLEGFAHKSAENLIRAIEASKERGLTRLLTALGITNVGESIAEALTKPGTFKSVDILLNATEKDIRDAITTRKDKQKQKHNEKAAHIIYEFLHSKKGEDALTHFGRDLDFAEWLRTVKIPRVQSARVRKLAKRFGNVDAFFNANAKQIRDALEERSIIAESVYEFFRSPQGRKIIDSLKAVGVKMSAEPAEAADGGGPLAGKIIVVTGTLENYTRGEIKEAIKRHGGRVVAGVSKKTDFVLAGVNPGSKTEKAKSLGVKIINEKEFGEVIGQK